MSGRAVRDGVPTKGGQQVVPRLAHPVQNMSATFAPWRPDRSPAGDMPSGGTSTRPESTSSLSSTSTAWRDVNPSGMVTKWRTTLPAWMASRTSAIEARERKLYSPALSL